MEMPSGAGLYKCNFTHALDLLEGIKNFCKGKAIFLDYWATWWKPCLEAMPYNKRLQLESKNLPIEFIYICTDINTSIYNWISKVTVLRQPGMNLFVNNEIILEMWQLLPAGDNFPTYFFIDKNGHFIPGAIPLHTTTPVEKLMRLIK